MLKRKLVTVTKEVLVPEEVTCNKCGLSCSIEHGRTEDSEFVEVRHVWGYSSHKDGLAHRFHLCEACYDAIVVGFAVPVETRVYCFRDPFDPEDELRHLRWQQSAGTDQPEEGGD